MLFSTNQGNIKPQILFNIDDVEFEENHKHLGVTFSSNCKWHCHIQNILKSTSGQLSMLHKFKIKLNRENLENIYFSYIRPVLEYACELWEGCTILDLNKIEQIQHEAARIRITHRFSRLVTLLFHKWLIVRLNHKDACILTLTK